jgi:hypothetical protein
MRFGFPKMRELQRSNLVLGTVHRFSDGVVLDLADFGDGWVFGRGLTEEQRWCVTAFEHAGERVTVLDSTTG